MLYKDPALKSGGLFDEMLWRYARRRLLLHLGTRTGGCGMKQAIWTHRISRHNFRGLP
jgi:hypothetical protein